MPFALFGQTRRLLSTHTSPLERLKLEREQGIDVSSSTGLTAMPSTSTKFQRKTRENDTIVVSPLVVEETKWDFHALTNRSVFDVEQKSQADAENAVARDENGYVIDNIDRLSKLPTLTLAAMALGQGEFAVKNHKQQPKHSPSSVEDSEYARTIEEMRKSGKLDGTTLLELDEQFDVLAAFRRLDPENNVFRGFTDPVPLPRDISANPLVNPIAGRALGSKFSLEMHHGTPEQPYGIAGNEHNDMMRQASLEETSTLWYARASYSSDAPSTLHMANFCENKLNLQLRFYGPDDLDDEGGEENGDVIDIESRRDLSDETKLEVELAYEEASKALLPRLRGQQFQGIDYRTTHPFVSTLYYFELHVQQSNDIYALASFAEWLFGMDELFAEVLDDDLLQANMGNFTDKKIDELYETPIQQRVHHRIDTHEEPTDGQIKTLSDPTTSSVEFQPIASNNTVYDADYAQNEHTSTDIHENETQDAYFHPATFIGCYFQFYLRPLTLHPIYGPDAMILLSRLLRSYGDPADEADQFESLGIQNGGVTIEERIEELHRKRQHDDLV